jgi:hypothetical protein
MSHFELAERTKNALLAGWPADLGPSPFAEPGYVKYDALTISDAPDAVGGVRVTFRFGGHDVLWMRVEGTAMKDGNTLHLSGIEGRMRCSVTT